MLIKNYIDSLIFIATSQIMNWNFCRALWFGWQKMKCHSTSQIKNKWNVFFKGHKYFSAIKHKINVLHLSIQLTLEILLYTWLIWGINWLTRFIPRSELVMFQLTIVHFITRYQLIARVVHFFLKLFKSRGKCLYACVTDNRHLSWDRSVEGEWPRS